MSIIAIGFDIGFAAPGRFFSRNIPSTEEKNRDRMEEGWGMGDKMIKFRFFWRFDLKSST